MNQYIRSSHRRCSIKKVLLEISQNSRENICASSATSSCILLRMCAQKEVLKKVIASLLPYIFHVKTKWNIVYEYLKTKAISRDTNILPRTHWTSNILDTQLQPCLDAALARASFLIKLHVLGLQLYQIRDSGAGAFMWILQNF